MLFSIYILFLIIPTISTDESTSFCLCALKTALEEYALFTTDRLPPRYHPLHKEDIGFYIQTSSDWKPVNSATWVELSSMINEPTGMYTKISLDGIHPINNGLQLDSLRSAYLADIITAYRSLINYIDVFHENIIKRRSGLCKMENEQEGKSSLDNWRQFF